MNATERAAIHTYVDKIVAEAPPLTTEQRTKLAELLRPARDAIAQARLEQLGAGGDAA